MVEIPGGAFLLGADDQYPEEAPVREQHVEPFLIDRHPVTNADFARFVSDTGYVTAAEQLVAGRRRGSAVFRSPAGPVSLDDATQWWAWVEGASWAAPTGPGSDLDGRDDHPVVHVTAADAQAYAQWAGKALPTEEQWEVAARGGLTGAAYAWGDVLEPDGARRANIWLGGEFPWLAPREVGTEPVGSYPPNGYGLLDMIGNVWECDLGLQSRRAGTRSFMLWHQRPLRRRDAGATSARGASCAEGRLLPVLAQLLRSVPACRANRATPRRVVRPHRLPLRSGSGLKGATEQVVRVRSGGVGLVLAELPVRSHPPADA